MDRLFGERPFDLKATFDFSRLEKPVKNHLKNVYASLTIAMFAAALGTYVSIVTGIIQGGFLLGLVGLGLMLWLAMTEHTPENIPKRMGILAAFGFCEGALLAPAIQMIGSINPSIVTTAFMGTTIIFICFTLAALYSDSRSFLYLGGLLMSALSILIITSLLNIFLGSKLLFQLELYAGLAIFCLFVLFDTQMIIYRVRNGDRDYIMHSVDLFLDFIQIFRHLMTILASKEENNKKRK